MRWTRTNTREREEGTPEAEGHGGVIGGSSGGEFEVMAGLVGGYRREGVAEFEFDGGTEGVADCETEEGGEDTVCGGWEGFNWLGKTNFSGLWLRHSVNNVEKI